MRNRSPIAPNVTAKRVFLAALITSATLGSFALLGAGCGGKKPPKPAEPALIDTSADAGSDAEPEDAAPPAPKSLFDRLGGKDGIDKLVESLVQNVTADGKLKKSFSKVKGEKLDNFKKSLSEQICEIAGGPCKYQGKDMKSAHEGISINDSQWDAFVQDFSAAMDENKIEENEKNELMALFAPLRADIVGSKKKK